MTSLTGLVFSVIWSVSLLVKFVSMLMLSGIIFDNTKIIIHVCGDDIDVLGEFFDRLSVSVDVIGEKMDIICAFIDVVRALVHVVDIVVVVIFYGIAGVIDIGDMVGVVTLLVLMMLLTSLILSLMLLLMLLVMLMESLQHFHLLFYPTALDVTKICGKIFTDL